MGVQKIPRLTDRDIAAKLETIHSKVFNGELGGVNISVLNQPFAVQFPNPPSDAWQALLAADGSAIESFSFTCDGVSLTYYRGGREATKSPYFDEIDLSIKSPEPTRIAKSAEITHLLRALNSSPVQGSSGDSQEQLVALQESRLERLERMFADGVERAAAAAEETEKRYQGRVAALEEAAQNRRLEQDAQLEAERERLRAAADALEQRKKALDDRDNTHVRRAIREGMLEDVKRRIGSFGVSEATQQKRRPVRTGILFLAMFLAIGWSVTFYELLRYEESGVVRVARSVVAAAASAASAASTPSSIGISEVAKALTGSPFDPAAYWLIWGRLVLLSFGLVAVLMYYIRWQNQWAERHSQSEFALQQFQLDVNRANWVLESCLEWRKETSSPIPRELLESITRGLFVPTDAPSEPALNPADELAKAILGSSSKLKLKAGDSEIELDKPGKIKSTAG